MLAERHPGRPLAGHSDLGGFWIIGDLSVEELASAIQEARARLESGESKLAVHPNCGTNFATSGVLAGLAAAVVMFGVGKRARDNLDRLPLAILVATLALIVSQPLGHAIAGTRHYFWRTGQVARGRDHPTLARKSESSPGGYRRLGMAETTPVVYFLHGEDEYAIAQELAELEKRLGEAGHGRDEYTRVWMALPITWTSCSRWPAPCLSWPSAGW